MIQLEEDKGIPKRLLVTMAAIAGFTVANCYYNQPLLEMIREELDTTEIAANFITVITQIGYALGLFFIIPMGDLYSRRRIIITSMTIAAVMALTIALSYNVRLIWVASLILGACSVIPQIFMPIAGQFSRPEDKSKNIGIILSGLLTGILASRVLSGYMGEVFGWREMFVIAAVLMALCLIATLKIIPEMKHNFKGTYSGLMRSVWKIAAGNSGVRTKSIRAAFGFGSMMSIWSCMAFHISGEPFNAGADMVGMLGLCGVVGAVIASGLGKYVPRFGIRRFSIVGAILQLTAWVVALTVGNAYVGLILAIILVDIGAQCLQLSNQSGCIQAIPEASNRVNTIFMTTFFIGGSLGTFCSGLAWDLSGWTGVCLVGILFAAISLTISIFSRE